MRAIKYAGGLDRSKLDGLEQVGWTGAGWMDRSYPVEVGTGVEDRNTRLYILLVQPYHVHYGSVIQTVHYNREKCKVRKIPGFVLFKRKRLGKEGLAHAKLTEHQALRHKLKSCTVQFLYRSDLVKSRRMVYSPDVCNCTMP